MAQNLRMDEITAKDLMVRKLVTVGSEATLSEAIGKMREHGFHELPVLNSNSAYMGLVSYEFLIRRRNLPLSTRVGNVLSIPPKVTEDENLPSVAEKMLSSDVRALPVLSKKGLVGVISRTDVVQVISSIKELKEVSVGSVMSPSPVCVSERDGVNRAKSLIRELDEQNIPVVDNDGRLTGIVGLKDIAPVIWVTRTKERKGEIRGERFSPDIEIKGVMRPPITVPLGTSIGDAVELMKENKITSVIVAENRKPVGIVTQLDLIELIARSRKREKVYVQLTGLREEDASVYDSLYAVIQKSLQRIGKIAVPTMLSLHVAQYNPEGGASKYSLRARLNTSKRMFFARAHDWNLMKATDELMRVLERMVRTDKEKKLELKRKPKEKLARLA